MANAETAPAGMPFPEYPLMLIPHVPLAPVPSFAGTPSAVRAALAVVVPVPPDAIGTGSEIDAAEAAAADALLLADVADADAALACDVAVPALVLADVALLLADEALELADEALELADDAELAALAALTCAAAAA